MRDIKNLNIWKQEPVRRGNPNFFYGLDIVELNLSVRSYNCLKRAGCNTVGDILPFLAAEEEGQGGLRRIRNLGARSEQEIKEKMKELEDYYRKNPFSGAGSGGYGSGDSGSYGSENPTGSNPRPGKHLVRPARNTMQMNIEQFPLSRQALQRLRACGIHQVSDIYKTDSKKDPG